MPRESTEASHLFIMISTNLIPKRLDVCVMEARGFSRTYAKEVIEAGQVRVRGRVVTKAGVFVDIADVEITAPDMPFVGRGGLKLAHALSAFCINLSGVECLDIGSSTGGFTDCMLKAGASQVYAVDVGKGQMVEAMRNDARVCLFEETDIRDPLLKEKLPPNILFVACDLSFISIGKVLASIRELIADGGELVCLIKPQFETQRRHLNKRGVVASEKHRSSALENALESFRQNGYIIVAQTESPITGGDGNVEYLIHAKI